MTRLLLAAAMLLAAGVALPAADDWPLFRGNPLQTPYPGTHVAPAPSQLPCPDAALNRPGMSEDSDVLRVVRSRVGRNHLLVLRKVTGGSRRMGEGARVAAGHRLAAVESL